MTETTKKDGLIAVEKQDERPITFQHLKDIWGWVQFLFCTALVFTTVFYIGRWTKQDEVMTNTLVRYDQSHDLGCNMWTVILTQERMVQKSLMCTDGNTYRIASSTKTHE